MLCCAVLAANSRQHARTYIINTHEKEENKAFRTYKKRATEMGRRHVVEGVVQVGALRGRRGGDVAR